MQEKRDLHIRQKKDVPARLYLPRSYGRTFRAARPCGKKLLDKKCPVRGESGFFEGTGMKNGRTKRRGFAVKGKGGGR